MSSSSRSLFPFPFKENRWYSRSPSRVPGRFSRQRHIYLITSAPEQICISRVDHFFHGRVQVRRQFPLIDNSSDRRLLARSGIIFLLHRSRYILTPARFPLITQVSLRNFLLIVIQCATFAALLINLSAGNCIVAIAFRIYRIEEGSGDTVFKADYRAGDTSTNPGEENSFEGTEGIKKESFD